MLIKSCILLGIQVPPSDLELRLPVLTYQSRGAQWLGGSSRSGIVVRGSP